MVLTVFRSRLRPESLDDYSALAPQIAARARSMPGYKSHKVFVAEDGERVTLVEFESEEAQRGWSQDHEHLNAKAQGRRNFYAEYTLQVCTVMRESRYKAP